MTLIDTGQTKNSWAFIIWGFFQRYGHLIQLSVDVCVCQWCCSHMKCIFLLQLVPEIATFVVVGLIPLSAPASWAHCVSFCYPQEGKTRASVFGLATSKSALLVLAYSLSLSQSHWMSVSNWEQRVLFCLSRGAPQHKAFSCVDVGLWRLSHCG